MGYLSMTAGIHRFSVYGLMAALAFSSLAAALGLGLIPLAVSSGAGLTYLFARFVTPAAEKHRAYRFRNTATKDLLVDSDLGLYEDWYFELRLEEEEARRCRRY